MIKSMHMIDLFKIFFVLSALFVLLSEDEV